MTKRELSRYRDICREIEQITEQLDELEQKEFDAAQKAVREAAGAGRGRTDKVGARLVRKEDLEHLYDQKQISLLVTRRRIENALESLQEPRDRALMRYRYFDGLSWEKVALKMNYSLRAVYELHEKILQKLERVQ